MSDLERITITIPRTLMEHIDAEEGERFRSSVISSIIAEHYGEVPPNTRPAIPLTRVGASVDDLIDDVLSSPRFAEAVRAATKTRAIPRERAVRDANVKITDEVRAVLQRFSDMTNRPSVRAMKAKGVDVTNLHKWIRGAARSLPATTYEEILRIVENASG
jgi:hypothetical protein